MVMMTQPHPCRVHTLYSTHTVQYTHCTVHILRIDVCSAASVLAFDQYGRLSEQLEMESTLRNKAENIATQVS